MGVMKAEDVNWGDVLRSMIEASGAKQAEISRHADGRGVFIARSDADRGGYTASGAQVAGEQAEGVAGAD